MSRHDSDRPRMDWSH